MTISLIAAFIKKFAPEFIGAFLLALVIAAFMYTHHSGVVSGRADIQGKWDAQTALQKTAYAAFQTDQAGKKISYATLADSSEKNANTDIEKVQIVYRTIKQKANAYIASHPDSDACVLSADGLRIWNDANAGNTTTNGYSKTSDQAIAAGGVSATNTGK